MVKAKEVFGKLANPDSRAYSALINGCLKYDRLEEALAFQEAAVLAGVTVEEEVSKNTLFVAKRRGMDVTHLEDASGNWSTVKTAKNDRQSRFSRTRRS